MSGKFILTTLDKIIILDIIYLKVIHAISLLFRENLLG